MQIKKISTGTQAMDDLLDGGYEADAITTIYGPAGSGKTNLAILAAVGVAGSGKKVIYIDTEGGFSVTRLKQVAPSYKKIIEKIIFLNPTTFSEQIKSIEKLRNLVNNNIGLIVIDTIAMLYRLELKGEDVHAINKALGMQIAILTEITRKKGIPVIITNQVYTLPELNNKVNMVGGDILKYGSKCLIELQAGHKGIRKAIIRKHRSIAGEKEALFKIVENGIESASSCKENI